MAKLAPFCIPLPLVLQLLSVLFRSITSGLFRSITSLLRIISRVTSARAFKNGGFFFMTGARQRGKLSFFSQTSLVTYHIFLFFGI